MAGAHSQKGQPRPKTASGGHRGWLLAITLTLVAVVAVGVAAVAVRGDYGRAAASPTTSPAHELGLTSTGPFRVVALTPANGTHPGGHQRNRLRGVLRAAQRPLTHAVTQPGRRRHMAVGDAGHLRLRGHRSAGAVSDGDGHRPRRRRRSDQRHRQEADRRGDLPLHRGAGKHPPPPTASGPARLPSGHLHADRSARRTPGGRRAPGGLIRLAVDRAGFADRSVDRRALPTCSPPAR